MTMRKKLLITIACLSVILCVLVTGTIAWLTAETVPITNIFTPSKVAVTLAETTFNGKMVPGMKIAKNPLVTVTSDIKSYVFLVVTEANNLNTYIDYALDVGENAWMPLDGVPNVYYRIAEVGTNNYSILVAGAKWGDNEVYVKESVTMTQMAELYDSNGEVKADDCLPQLSFAAYVCQYEGMANAAAAWTAINTSVNP